MISFALPWALLGLVAAGIPLFLHLVQRHEPREQFFPAVRYLEAATRDHRRRLQFRNLLLLVIRTLLILALVLAAAGATLNRSGLGSHAPSALVLIVDNSASSAAILDGEPTLTALVRAAGEVLDRATSSDRLWLLTADGTVVPGSAAELRGRLQSIRSEPVRMDLGQAVTQARQVLRGAGRPGEVVLISDAQRSAIADAKGAGEVLLLRPKVVAPANHALAALVAESQPWGPEGGRVTIMVTSSDTAPLPVTLSLGSRRLRDVLVTPGIPSVQHIGPVAAGWTTLSAALPPDEFRLDDSRSVALRVAPAALVRWDASDRYLNVAMEVLASDGRIRAGEGVRIGVLGPGSSIVVPPADPARIGAVNRALTARGATWHFGALVVASGRTDSTAILPQHEPIAQRVALEPTGGSGDVLVTVDGAPWLVRSGNILLLGSRFDPAWSALPFSASFVPFLDALLSRVVRGEPPVANLAVSDSFRIPTGVNAAGHGGGREPVEAGSLWRPREPGSYWLIAGIDTVGGLSVAIDPRESDLTRVDDAVVQSLWSHVSLSDLAHGGRRAFALAGRGDLRGPLLGFALCCALLETGLVGVNRRRSA